MQQLLDLLTPDQPSKEWPKSARGLTARLAKLGPDLRKLGLDAGDTGEQDSVTRRTIWMIKEVPAQSFGSFNRSEAASEQPKRSEALPEGSQGADRDPSGNASAGSPGALALSFGNPSDHKPTLTCVDEGSKDPKDVTATSCNSDDESDNESFWAGLADQEEWSA